MIFKCKACAAALDKDDIDLSSGIATCSHCRAVMSFAGDLRRAGNEVSNTGPRAEVMRPENLEVEETPTRLRFARPWYGTHLYFLLFFCIAWNAFLIGWYTIGSQIPGPAKWIFLLFPIAHVAIGVGLSYSVLAGFLNRTVVEVTAHEVTIKHGPVPWKGNRKVRAADIKQLYCQGGIGGRRSRHAVGGYRLNAILTNKQKVTLLSKHADRDLVLYLEQQIEQRLGIKDQAVAGEIPRSL